MARVVQQHMVAAARGTHKPLPLMAPVGQAALPRAAGAPLNCSWEERALQPPHLASHCQDMWLQRLWAHA